MSKLFETSPIPKVLLPVACLLLARIAASAADPPLAHYTCYRTAGKIHIDGRLDEESWLKSPASQPFVDIVTGEPAWYETRVTLLWDDQYLYFGFTVPETNVVAALTEQDSKIYRDNDVELFIAGQNAYYEFEINAHNTIYEVFWIWPDALRPGGPYEPAQWDVTKPGVTTLAGVGGHVHPRGRRWGFLDWDYPGLRHAVHINGTLNDSSDTDQGWTVELALPWEGLRLLADGRSLPPANGDIWRIDCSRFQHFTREGEQMKRAAGWTWNKHGHYDSHIPETFSYVHFSRAPAGSGSGR
jgi:hypothetical protein